MPTLPNMSLITPTLGGDSGTWDDKINACFGLIDAHDHTAGKGVLIATAALDIDADLTFGGFNATHVGMLALDGVADPSTGVGLYRSEDDDELYWRTAGGDPVQLTNGTSLNTTLLGGIVGDYASVGAQLSYIDADATYTFKDKASPTHKWARIGTGPVRIYEYNTSESVYVEHAVAAALASSYTVTWPAALPAANAFVLIDASGVVTYTSSPTTTGTVTAAGYLFTTAKTMLLSAAALQRTGSTHVFNGTYWALGASSSDTLYANIPLNVGDRIKSVKLWLDKNSNASNTITLELWRSDPATSGGVATSLGAATNAENATGIASQPTISGLTTTAAIGHAYSVAVSQSAGAPSSSDFIFTIEVSYDRPV